MTEALPRYDIGALTLFTATILERAGLREADAEVSADILVTSDVYGIDSHEIARVGYYVNLISTCLIDVEASPVVERGTAVTAVVDARNGFGVLPRRASPWRAASRGRSGRGWPWSRCATAIPLALPATTR
jgi:LDH2 family malate/lactate/ureidoglycolate dehydrogenase